MATDKKISYINQDGYKNYIKNSDSITIPKKFKARKKAASTHLAYITKAEAAQLKKQNKGTPHKGPKGIPSYDSFDAAGGYSNPGGAGDKGGYSASSGGGGGGWQDSSRADQRANERAEQVRRNYVEKENISSSYLHDRYDPNRIEGRRSGIGGLLGGIGRGLLGFFGGIPGKIMSGIMSARNLARKTGTKIGEEVDEFSQYPTLDRYLNRNTDKYLNKPYKGQGKSNYTFNDTGQGNNLGLYTDTLSAPIGAGKRVGQDQGYYGMGSQYDPTRMPNNLGTNTQFVEEEETFNPDFYAGNKEGGRIGYERGRVVNPGGYQGEEEGVDSVKHAIMLEQMDKLEKMIASGLDSDGRLQARLDQLIATPTTGFGTGPDLVLPDDMAQGGIARLL